MVWTKTIVDLYSIKKVHYLKNHTHNESGLVRMGHLFSMCGKEYKLSFDIMSVI